MAAEQAWAIQLAPKYVLHRVVEDAVETPPFDRKVDGMQMADHRWANIQVLPSALANPDIVVLFWSEEAGQFIQEHAPTNFAGKGAGVPYEVSVEVHGRLMLVAVISGTMAGGDVVKIMTSGYGVDER